MSNISVMRRSKLIKATLALLAALFVLTFRLPSPNVTTISPSEDVVTASASEGVPTPTSTLPAVQVPTTTPSSTTLVPHPKLAQVTTHVTPKKPIAQPLSTKVSRPLSTPSSLSIPSLTLSATIQPVGVDPNGRMSVPTAPHTVGWYEDGTIPGKIGSAVLDAHVYAAFKTLKNIKVGANVYVTDVNGNRLRFIVSAIRTYVYTQVPVDLLFERADAARLNLITCSGTWLPSQGTYDHRTVVYAMLAP